MSVVLGVVAMAAGATGFMASLMRNSRLLNYDSSDEYVAKVHESLCWSGGASLLLVIVAGIPFMSGLGNFLAAIAFWALLVGGVRVWAAYLRFRALREYNYLSVLSDDLPRRRRWIRSSLHVALLWSAAIITLGMGTLLLAAWGMGAIAQDWDPVRANAYYDTTSTALVQVVVAMMVLAMAAAGVHMVKQAVLRGRYGTTRPI